MIIKYYKVFYEKLDCYHIAKKDDKMYESLLDIEDEIKSQSIDYEFLDVVDMTIDDIEYHKLRMYPYPSYVFLRWIDGDLTDEVLAVDIIFQPNKTEGGNKNDN